MDPVFYIAIVIFAIAYAFIISEKLHRTVAALTGAVLMIALGILNQERAIAGIDFNTLGLLIGMMVIVDIARHSGVFQFVALWSAKMGKGKPIQIFILLGIVTAVFSAFLDNVTTVLLMVPVTFVVAHNLKVNPKPFLFGTILLSNIGGAATLIGDPPNILVGSAAKIPFIDFLIHLGPVSLVTLAVTLVLLFLWYRRELVATPEAQATIMNFRPREAITNMPLLVKSLVVLGVVMLGFFTHATTHIEGATIALAGAALLLILTLRDPEEHLHHVEWTTIFFFVGLFILVTGLEHVGAIGMMAEGLLSVTQGNPTAMILLMLWGSAFFSAIVDNIPFVATMIPLIKDIGMITGMDLAPLWWALLLGADFGGNATLVGASANVVVSGMAEKEGQKIGFFEYMKTAVPLTIVALVIATAYLYLFYV